MRQPCLVVSLVLAHSLSVHTALIAQVADRPEKRWAGQFDRADMKRASLDTTSEARLRAAEQKGLPISFLLAAYPGRTSDVVRDLTQLGGTVIFRADEVSYIRGMLPSAKARTLFSNSNVLNICFGDPEAEAPLPDQEEALGTPAAHFRPKDFLPVVESSRKVESTNAFHPDSQLGPKSSPPLLSRGKLQQPQFSGDLHAPRLALPQNDLRDVNPFLPTYLMGVPQFVREHPTFDGRGVTIAVLGAGGDVDHPMLQTGRLLDGSIVSKTVDFGEVSRKDTSGVIGPNLAEVAADKDGFFTASGVRYRAPRAGTYRFGMIRLDERTFGTLWDEKLNVVWVDASGRHDFRTEPSSTDFTLWHQSLRLPASDLGFYTSVVIKTYPQEHILKAFIPSDHETQVTSVAAGGSFIGSQATGVAPGARVIYFFPFKGAFVESFLFAERDTRVDLITCSFDLSDSPDGEDVQSEVLDRIIAHYGKPVVKASGNASAAVESIEGAASASRVITVGTYSSHASDGANSAGRFKNQENEYVNEEGGSGPSGLGGIKPDLIAPSPSSRAYPCGSLHVSRSDFATIRCYTMGDGQSSMAAPMVAGALAVLISAAKQTDTPYDNDRLRQALVSTAHHLPDWPIDRQGGGLPQIAAAWKELRSPSNSLIKVLASAPITAPTGYNKLPGFGVGIYETLGWRAGRSDERRLTLLRVSGKPGEEHFDIASFGSDANVFSIPPSITLPLGKPVDLVIRAIVPHNGVFSTLLRLTEADTRKFAAQFGAYIICSEEVGLGKREVAEEGVLSRNRGARFFYDLQPGIDGIEVTLPEKSRLSISVWNNAHEVDMQAVSGGVYRSTSINPGLLQVLVRPPDDDDAFGPESLANERVRVVLRGTSR